MLQYIHDSGISVKDYVAKVKDKSSHIKLMGFGHRVYKNYDPRAKIIKQAADRVLNKLKIHDPMLDLARALEEAALSRRLLQGEEALPERGLLLRHHHARHRHPGEHVHGHVRHRPHARLDCQLEGSLGRPEPHLPPAAGLRRADRSASTCRSASGRSCRFRAWAAAAARAPAGRRRPGAPGSAAAPLPAASCQRASRPLYTPGHAALGHLPAVHARGAVLLGRRAGVPGADAT